jgi:hypothetical protein
MYLGKKRASLNVGENHEHSRGLTGSEPSIGPIHGILQIIIMFNIVVWGVRNDEKIEGNPRLFVHLLIPSICHVSILNLCMAIISRFLVGEVVFHGGINKGKTIMRFIEVFEHIPLLVGRTIFK